MMHGTYNETRGQDAHLTSRSASFTTPATAGAELMCAFVFYTRVRVCTIFVMCVTEECRHQSVSSEGLHPPVHPAVIYTRSPQPTQHSDVIDWMITLALPSIRSSPVVNQRLVSPRSLTSTLAILVPHHSVN